MAGRLVRMLWRYARQVERLLCSNLPHKLLPPVLRLLRGQQEASEHAVAWCGALVDAPRHHVPFLPRRGGRLAAG
jgi:hypothetical protein